VVIAAKCAAPRAGQPRQPW